MYDFDHMQQVTGWFRSNTNKDVEGRMLLVPILTPEGDETDRKQAVLEHRIVGHGIHNNGDVAISKVTDKAADYHILKQRFRDVFQAYEEEMDRRSGKNVKKTETKKQGQSLMTWDGLPLSVRETLVRGDIHTIEDLAELPEITLRKLGAGSQAWKTKAKKYLKDQKEEA